jgi:uncharacterized protein (TIGR00730 family)
VTGKAEGPWVGVFGGSEPPPKDPVYQLALELGRGLGKAGFHVATGGYGGVMEAASQGAREMKRQALGVTSEVFADRGGANRFVSVEHSEPDLLLRTRTLIIRSDAFVVLPGHSGTLAELTALWALHRAGLLGKRPIVLLGAVWPGLLQDLENRGLLKEARRQVTRCAGSPAEAVDLVALGLKSWDRFCMRGEQG